MCQTCPFKILNLIEEKNVDKIEQVCISLPPSAVPETVSFQPRVKWVLTNWALTCFGAMFTHRERPLTKYEFYNVAERAQLIIGNNGEGT